MHEWTYSGTAGLLEVFGELIEQIKRGSKEKKDKREKCNCKMKVKNTGQENHNKVSKRKKMRELMSRSRRSKDETDTDYLKYNGCDSLPRPCQYVTLISLKSEKPLRHGL